MGIVGTLSICALVLAGFFLWFKLRMLASEDSGTWLLWLSRGVLFVVVLAVLSLVNAFVEVIPSPFDGPKAENLPAHAPRTPAPKKVELEAVPSSPNFDEAAAEHQRRLEKFEGKSP